MAQVVGRVKSNSPRAAMKQRLGKFSTAGSFAKQHILISGSKTLYFLGQPLDAPGWELEVATGKRQSSREDVACFPVARSN